MGFLSIEEIQENIIEEIEDNGFEHQIITCFVANAYRKYKICGYIDLGRKHTSHLG
jgi:hypothetical protein